MSQVIMIRVPVDAVLGLTVAEILDRTTPPRRPARRSSTTRTPGTLRCTCGKQR